MDKCSFFINNKGLFGSYPDQTLVNQLISEENVEIFLMAQTRSLV